MVEEEAPMSGLKINSKEVEERILPHISCGRKSQKVSPLLEISVEKKTTVYDF